MADLGKAVIDEVAQQAIDNDPTRVQFWNNTPINGDIQAPPQQVIDELASNN
jgi:hypothetical protein